MMDQNTCLKNTPGESRKGTLTWDDSYALAILLRQAHPLTDLQSVSLNMIFGWIMELPDFIDDPTMVNDGILSSIIQEWYEEEENAL